MDVMGCGFIKARVGKDPLPSSRGCYTYKFTAWESVDDKFRIL